MSVIDDIREMLGQFRAGVTELAEADRKQLAELQRLRITTARQADELDEQRGIIARLRSENRAHDANHLRSYDVMGETVDISLQLRIQLADAEKLAATQRSQLDQAALHLGAERQRSLELQLELARVREQLKAKHMGLVEQTAAQLTSLGLIGCNHSKDVPTVADEERQVLTAHVRTLLGILDAIGGYMPSGYQAAIRAAREAVGRG